MPVDTCPATSHDEVPLERLEVEITTLAGQIAAATCRFLLAVAAYDRREGWGTWGCRSMVHWLSWRCGIAPSTAREQVRVARALVALPAVTAAFSAGRLSYSQARAISRVASPATEASLVELAGECTAGQLDRILATWRRVNEVEGHDGDAVLAERRGLWSWGDEDGSVVVMARLAPADARSLLRAVDADAAATWEARRHAVDAGEAHPPVDGTDHPAARRADALVALVGRGATGEPSPLAGRSLTVLHLDAGALDTTGAEVPAVVRHVDGRPVSNSTARRISCDTQVMPVVDRADGTSVDVGRHSRVPSVAQRRALLARDRHCTFPGCLSRAELHAHHVRHWADGGPTDLANLTLLCAHHHRRLHERRWSMEADPTSTDAERRACPSKRWRFSRPDGRTIPGAPRLAHLDDPHLPDDLPDIAADTVVPDWDGTTLSAWTLSCVVDDLLRRSPARGSAGGGASAEAPRGDGRRAAATG